MLQLTPQSRIFLAVEPVDFHCGIDRLAAFCRQRLAQNPLEGALSVFPNTPVPSPNAGVFAALRDEMLFRQVRLELGAVTWPGEIGLAPDAMYAAIRQTGRWALI
ncbi:MAG TPA: IS66 family insertion sequence element accessory protein TnpB [Gammaproteobacteria bacterium]|nr:IS66 family insertion sequence element accessory protein TnpB [Gammaproteobacteria bacterium]